MLRKAIADIEAKYQRNDVPDLRAGDTVRVHTKIKEGDKERIQIFEGVVIARRHGGVRASFTVRKVSYGVGVERIFPTHSPRIDKIEVTGHGEVRRSRLFYLRDLQGKAARLTQEESSHEAPAPPCSARADSGAGLAARRRSGAGRHLHAGWAPSGVARRGGGAAPGEPSPGVGPRRASLGGAGARPPGRSKLPAGGRWRYHHRRVLLLEFAAQGVRGVTPAGGRAHAASGLQRGGGRRAGRCGACSSALLLPDPRDGEVIPRSAGGPGAGPVRAGLTLVGADRVTYRLVRDFGAGCQLHRFDPDKRAFAPVSQDLPDVAALLRQTVGVPSPSRLAALLTLTVAELPSRADGPGGAHAAAPGLHARPRAPASAEEARQRVAALEAELVKAEAAEKLQYQLDGLQSRLFKLEEALRRRPAAARGRDRPARPTAPRSSRSRRPRRCWATRRPSWRPSPGPPRAATRRCAGPRRSGPS